MLERGPGAPSPVPTCPLTTLREKKMKHSLIYRKKPKDRAHRMAQQVKVLVAHPDDQSSILRIYMIEELTLLFFPLHVCHDACVCTAHKQINKCKKRFLKMLTLEQQFLAILAFEGLHTLRIPILRYSFYLLMIHSKVKLSTFVKVIALHLKKLTHKSFQNNEK